MARPVNEPIVHALWEPMGKIKAKDVEKASKPAGLLFRWCHALLECDENIKNHRVVLRKLQAAEEEAGPRQQRIEKLRAKLADDEATVALIENLTRGL